ncbi:MAG TPA: hypothetical protein VFG58_05305 [Solirubrobacterales bacterium]|nr:hypothetical protein [Solirubrobacterales bacterium]
MHDDPTRMMGQPEQPGGNRPHGNVRLLVAGLIAVIVGLAIAIVVIASNDGGESASTVTTEVLPSETTATESTPSTGESTATEPTTGEEEAEEGGESTSGEPTPAPEEEAEENGSGGIPAE